ncbi:MAG: hypothetical protein L0H84_17210 [Pseudonocardia sp.]|nr:hypothetical protein [Pseudonocardia sp.]
MSDDPTPRRERVVLSTPRLNPAEVRARRLYAELPWWRRLLTRTPKGWR